MARGLRRVGVEPEEARAWFRLMHNMVDGGIDDMDMLVGKNKPVRSLGPAEPARSAIRFTGNRVARSIPPEKE